MKVVILAGGYGTRLAEETKIKPKPLVKIGGKPIIWHLIKIYNYYGINNFVMFLQPKPKYRNISEDKAFSSLLVSFPLKTATLDLFDLIIEGFFLK